MPGTLKVLPVSGITGVDGLQKAPDHHGGAFGGPGTGPENQKADKIRIIRATPEQVPSHQEGAGFQVRPAEDITAPFNLPAAIPVPVIVQFVLGRGERLVLDADQPRKGHRSGPLDLA
jgi:hypothetical protein